MSGPAKFNQTTLKKDFQTNRAGRPSMQLKQLHAGAPTHGIVDIDDYDSPIAHSSNEIAMSTNSVVPAKRGRKPGVASKNTDISQLLLSIKSDTTATRADIKSTRTELKSDINKLSVRTDAKFAAVEQQLAKANEDIKVLFSKVRDVDRLAKNSTASGDIELHKQMQLRNNVSIANIPFVDGENLYDILCAVLKRIGSTPLLVDDLLDAKRIRGSRSNLIVAKFRDCERKIEVMRKKSAATVMLADIFTLNASDPNPRIYINSQMTPHYSKLAYLGRIAVSNGLIHSSWLASRGFLVKVAADSNPVVVTNEKQLDDLVGSDQRPALRKRDRSFDNETSPTLIRPNKLKAGSSESVNQINEATNQLKLAPEGAAATMETP